MKTLKRLQPGQPGTKKLLEKYGDKLVCVRYRYDREQKWRTKTAEIIIDEGPLDTSIPRIPANKLVFLRIDFDEMHLRKLVKAADGRWNPDEKLWELPYKIVCELGLRKRIVERCQ